MYVSINFTLLYAFHLIWHSYTISLELGITMAKEKGERHRFGTSFFPVKDYNFAAVISATEIVLQKIMKQVK